MYAPWNWFWLWKLNFLYYYNFAFCDRRWEILKIKWMKNYNILRLIFCIEFKSTFGKHSTANWSETNEQNSPFFKAGKWLEWRTRLNGNFGNSGWEAPSVKSCFSYQDLGFSCKTSCLLNFLIKIFICLWSNPSIDCAVSLLKSLLI